MIFQVNVPKNSVQALPMPKISASKLQFKPNSYRKRLPIVFYSIAVFLLVFAAQPVAAQMDLKFGTNYTRISGSALQEGTKYLYSDVAVGFDCIVTIDDIQDGASLYAFDNNSSTYDGEVNRFQPIITSPQSCARKSYVKFKFQLIASDSYNSATGTYTLKTPTEPIWFRAYDIDGNGTDKGISEFVELSGAFTGSWVDNPTNLTATTAIMTGGDQYKISTPTINGDNISDEGKYAFNGFIYANTANTWYIIGGSYTGGNQGDPVGTNQLTDADRLNSWSFYHDDVKPGIDFGDAPSSYNGSSPIVPAYHVVPSVATNVKIYLGAIKPDVDFGPEGNAKANVDDANNATDDEDGLGFTFFPKYSGTGAYTVDVKVTNTSGSNAYLYGYIDFNGDGDFLDAGEKSAQVIVSSSTSLQTKTVSFSGFTYTAAANRYARFRVSSSNTQAGTANGGAIDGEVEDYRFDVAINVSGTVFLDADGLTDAAIDGTGIAKPANIQLYAILVNADGKVIESVPVSSTAGAVGTFTFSKAGTNNSFTAIISTTAGTVGSTPPAAALPSNWVYTAEGINATSPDGTANGTISGTIGTSESNITGLAFGIEQLPETENRSIALTGALSGIPIQLTSTPLRGTDPEDNSGAAITTGGKFVITQLPSVGTLKYNGTTIVIGAASATITNYQPSLLTITYPALTTPVGTSFKYSLVDAADKADPTPATYSITITSILPLNGLELSANQQGSNVKLTWKASGEHNVTRYELEYSTTSTNFTSLTSVAYRTSADGNNTYTYTHLPTTTSGVLYYRVIQYRADGSSIISNLVSVRLNDKNGSSVTVMPTLITDMTNIRLQTATAGKTVINVVDNNGKLVMKKEFSLNAGSTSFALDGWQALSNGMYYIQVKVADVNTTVRVIVQH